MTQPEVIYAHARNLASGFFTNLLKVPLIVDTFKFTFYRKNLQTQ